MANHLGNATHVKAHTGHAACHCLDNGIGQVVLQRGGNKQIHGIIEFGNFGLTAQVVNRINRQRQRLLDVLGITTQHDNAQFAWQCGMMHADVFASLNQIAEALALIGNALGTKEE